MADGTANPYSNTFACPECGGRLEVYRTLPRPTCVRRVRVCTRCSAQFDSVEQITKRKDNSTIALPIAQMVCTTVEQESTSPSMTTSTHIQPRGEASR
jgi:hypothetical protein